MIVGGLRLEVVDSGMIAQNIPSYCIFVLTFEVNAWVRVQTSCLSYSLGDRMFLLSHSVDS